MIITLVNQSDYLDEFIQEVIRAVNRQVEEDFAPYWHRSGRLRLEGPIADWPSPDSPEEMRGDAILYLCSECEDAIEALGYHAINFRGIPFSMVFTDLVPVGAPPEEWTVTLSHEVLELLMDPEANLLVQGPHPEEPDRIVYHWYEVCDAVQAQAYEIDGIRVSNFVLPLYFTEHDEEGSRNDFLGVEFEDGPLRSFGVAPGGYIGFYDPLTDRHESHFARTGNARERFALKDRAGFARRSRRRQISRSPEPDLRRLSGADATGPLPGPWFEAFSVSVRAASGEDPYDRLEAAASTVLGNDWHEHWLAVEPTDPEPSEANTSYELVANGAPLSVGEAWELCYRLRECAGVSDVEPDFVCFSGDASALLDLPAARRWSTFGTNHLPESMPAEWSLGKINAIDAWELTKGQGVSVGHPDTGFFEHPEIWPGAGPGPIDTGRDYDFIDDWDDAHAEADQDGLLPGGPNHGTATASVTVSARGAASGGVAEPFVSGVSPKAKLVPLRVSNSVVHFSWRRLSKAIEYAANQGVHVLSMSLGGPLPSRHLRRAIQAASRRGVILIAAAGNDIPFRPVVYPARYPEVVAVAASNALDQAWSGSSHGATVDITAPGESVWRALVDVDKQGSARFQVERSHGTSYATAQVAGVCALWLSRFGPDFLFQRYGDQLTNAFRFVVHKTARGVDDLDKGEFGPGIINADAVIRRELPSLAQVRAWANGAGLAMRAAAGGPPSAENDRLAEVGALLPHLSRREVRSLLEDLLGARGEALRRQLTEVGDELVFHLGVDPRLRRQLGAAERHTRSLGRSGPNRALRVGTFSGARSRLLSRASARLQGLVR